MPISKSTLKSILGSIEEHHLALMVDILGKDALDPDEISRLLSKGLLPKDPTDLIEKAYEYGVVAGTGKVALKGMNLLEFIRMQAMTKPILTTDEHAAVEHARSTAATYIRGHASTLVKKAQAIIVEADRKLRRVSMLKAKKAGVIIGSEKTIKQEMLTALRKAIEDQKTGFFKIAATEVNNALQEGRLHSIIKSTPVGDDPLVYKRPHPDCCAYCKLLYLDKGMTPRIYHLSELVENGTNVGRKPGRPLAKSCGWKPTIGSTHPCCRCSLHYLPPGFMFNEKGIAVYKGRETAA